MTERTYICASELRLETRKNEYAILEGRHALLVSNDGKTCVVDVPAHRMKKAFDTPIYGSLTNMTFDFSVEDFKEYFVTPAKYKRMKDKKFFKGLYAGDLPLRS